LIQQIIHADEAADAKAGVGARDEEEASAVRVADADVFGGGSLARKIRCVSAGNGSEASGGAEKKARSSSRLATPTRYPV
jgi:hypothetical protein